MRLEEIIELIMFRDQRKALFNVGVHTSPPCLGQHVANLSCCRANPRIDHSATLTGGKGEYGIEIQFSDFRYVFDHAGNTEQDFLDRLNVGWSMASVTFEQAIAADCPNHFLRISVGERRHSKGDVGEDLHVDPAKTEGHERSEQRIFGHADHQLNPISNHALYDNALHAILFDLFERASNSLFILKIQTNRADVRLMKHALRCELGGHGKTQRGRNADGLFRSSGQTIGNLRYSKRG